MFNSKSRNETRLRLALKHIAALLPVVAIAACSEPAPPVAQQQPDDAPAVEAPVDAARETRVAEPEIAMSPLCATPDEAATVRAFYSEKRPGAPLPVPARVLSLIESKVASALPLEQSVGTQASSERFEDVWRTIDTWGEDTKVGFVVSGGGMHPHNHPTTVPVTQKEHRPGFYDVYAKGERGVHVHVNRDDLSLIYASQMPGKDGSKTRAVSFYNHDGKLVFAIYASEAGKEAPSQALDGFDRTWAKISEAPRACASNG